MRMPGRALAVAAIAALVAPGIATGSAGMSAASAEGDDDSADDDNFAEEAAWRCQFVWGGIVGRATRLGDSETMMDCVRQVWEAHPTAVAASYHAPVDGRVTGTECYAYLDDGVQHEPDEHRRSCIFERGIRRTRSPTRSPTNTSPTNASPTIRRTRSPSAARRTRTRSPTRSPTIAVASTGTTTTPEPGMGNGNGNGNGNTGGGGNPHIDDGDSEDTGGRGDGNGDIGGGGNSHVDDGQRPRPTTPPPTPPNGGSRGTLANLRPEATQHRPGTSGRWWVTSTPARRPATDAMFRCAADACEPFMAMDSLQRGCVGCLASTVRRCSWTTIDQGFSSCDAAIRRIATVPPIPANTESYRSTATTSVGTTRRAHFTINIGGSHSGDNRLLPGETTAAGGGTGGAENGTSVAGSMADDTDSSSASVSIPVVVGIMVAVLLCVVLVALLMARRSRREIRAGNRASNAGNAGARTMTINPSYMLPAEVQGGDYLGPTASNPSYLATKYGGPQYSHLGPGGDSSYDYDEADGAEHVYGEPGGGESGGYYQHATDAPNYAVADASGEYSPHHLAVNPRLYATADYDTADDTTGIAGAPRSPHGTPLAPADRTEEQCDLAGPSAPVPMTQPKLYAMASPNSGQPVPSAFWSADGSGRGSSAGAIHTADAGQPSPAPLTDVFARSMTHDRAAVWAAARQWLGLPIAFTKADAESLLAGPVKPGAFLIRSKTGGGGRVLSVRSPSAKVVHYRIDESDGLFSLRDSSAAEVAYTSLETLILGHVHAPTAAVTAGLPAAGVVLTVCVPPPAALPGIAAAAEDELAEIDGVRSLTRVASRYDGFGGDHFVPNTAGSISRKPSVYDGFTEI